MTDYRRSCVPQPATLLLPQPALARESTTQWFSHRPTTSGRLTCIQEALEGGFKLGEKLYKLQDESLKEFGRVERTLETLALRGVSMIFGGILIFGMQAEVGGPGLSELGLREPGSLNMNWTDSKGKFYSEDIPIGELC